MTEINKRILTSILLFTILFFCYYNKIILASFLLICFFQMTNEFYFIINKYYKSKKIYKFLSMIIVLTILSYLILFVWISLSSSSFESKLIFLLIVSITISSDIGGFIFGKIIKGKKLTNISPNKTYSGMIGSYTLSIIVTYTIFKDYLNINELIVFTLIISTASQIGDLFISYLKRNTNLKDINSILPGHGGLLDRFDGLILAIPIGSILFKIL